MKGLFRLFRILTGRKVFNVLLAVMGYVFSLLLRKPIVWGHPYALSVEPINHCNLSCPECPTGNHTLGRETEMLDAEQYEKILAPLAPYLIYHMLYLQGEPFLHPRITEMIAHAKTVGCYVLVSTNGHFLDAGMAERLVRSGLDCIIVSVDGTTQGVYENYRRGGSLQEVLGGISRLAACKRRLGVTHPLVEVQFLVTRHNEHQVVEVKKLYKTWGADKLTLKTCQVYDMTDPNGLIPENTRYARYRKKEGAYVSKRSPSNKCFRLWSTLVLLCNGKVVPCCYDKRGKYAISSATDNPLNAWHSPAMMQFRKKVLSQGELVDICCNCGG